MIPRIYEKTSTTFGNNYIGYLMDAISCTVTEGRNDEYELEMEYPVNGRLYSAIEQDAIILAKPNNQDAPQPFRIYQIKKAADMTIEVNARHIVYDLSKVVVEPFQSTGTIQDAITGMMNHAVPSCGFIFETDKTTAGNYKVSVPTSFRALMGGVRGSLLDVYGTAEYHYDGYNIDLLQSRGADRGVVIKYGISMTNLKQEEECDKVFTAVFPFWMTSTDYLQLDERIVSVEGEFPFSRIMTLDLSDEYDEKPTQAQLRNKTREYINENNIGVPSVDLDVDFSGTDAEQDINLCDIVAIEFEKMGITATAKCISLKYDVLLERVVSVKLGNYKNTFLDTVVDQMKGITDYAVLRTADIERAIQNITENENGYVLLHSSTNTGHIDEILILSGTDNLQTAQKIWRWNSGGFGYSSTGYNGSFGTAITMLGQIVADYVKTGTLRAVEIRSQNNTFRVTPQGFLTATSGYIGSTTNGFLITSTQIKNSSILLYQMGLGFLNSSGSDIAYFGRTDRTYVHSDLPDPTTPGGDTPESEEYTFWMEPASDALKPGVGMGLTSRSAGTALAYYDSSSDTNKMVFGFAKDNETSGLMTANALHFYKKINMHGCGFFGDFNANSVSSFVASNTWWQFDHSGPSYYLYMHIERQRYNNFKFKAGEIDNGTYAFDLSRMTYADPIPPDWPT